MQPLRAWGASGAFQLRLALKMIEPELTKTKHHQEFWCSDQFLSCRTSHQHKAQRSVDNSTGMRADQPVAAVADRTIIVVLGYKINCSEECSSVSNGDWAQVVVQLASVFHCKRSRYQTASALLTRTRVREGGGRADAE